MVGFGCGVGLSGNGMDYLFFPSAICAFNSCQKYPISLDIIVVLLTDKHKGILSHKNSPKIAPFKYGPRKPDFGAN